MKIVQLNILKRSIVNGELHQLSCKSKEYNEECWPSRAKIRQLNICRTIQPLLKELLLPDGKCHRLINIQDIAFCQAQGNYCTIYLQSGRQLTLSKTLKSLVKMLPKELFIRSHQSFIVNRHCIDKINSMTGIEIVINGVVRLIPIARRRKAELFKRLRESM